MSPGRAVLDVPAGVPCVTFLTDLASVRPAPPAAPTVVVSVRVRVEVALKVDVTEITFCALKGAAAGIESATMMQTALPAPTAIAPESDAAPSAPLSVP